MKTQETEGTSWIMNHLSPLSVTLSLPGTSQIFNWEMVSLLKLKDGSDQEIEQKCLELKRRIQNSILDLFSSEQILESENHRTALCIGNGVNEMASLGMRE